MILFLNKKGFSLIQVMVAVGLLAIVSMGVAELMVSSSRVSKSMNTRMERLIFYTELSNNLLTQQNCTAAINGQPFDLAQVNSINGMSVTLNLPGFGAIAPGADVQTTNLQVESLAISNAVDQGVPGQDVYRVELKARVKAKTNIVGGESLKPSPLPGIYVTVLGGAITSCSSELGVSYVCNKMDGIYDPVTDKCEVKPTPEEACNLVSGQFSGGNCYQNTYKKCGSFNHGQSFSTCSGGGCGGSIGSYSTSRRICLDGQVVTLSTDNGSNSPSCFTASTKVRMADETLKPISEVKIGEQVIGEYGQINNVIGIETPDLGARYLFSLNNGPFFVTAEHPFKTLNGWKSFDPAMTDHETPNLVSRKPMVLGDVLLRYNNDLEMLNDYQLKNDDKKMKVYNLLLDGNNTYFANDYLVHNKPGGGGAGGP